MENKRIWFGRVASYTPPAKVRPKQGTFKLEGEQLSWVGLGLTRRGSTAGSMLASHIAAVAVGNDGSVVVVSLLNGHEEHVAFWPNPREASPQEIAVDVEAWRLSLAASGESERDRVERLIGGSLQLRPPVDWPDEGLDDEDESEA